MGEGSAVFLAGVNYLKESSALGYSDKLFFLQQRAGLNERVKTNCLHISLNFESKEQISNDKMQQIAKDYMARVGFGEQPLLIYRHLDAGHPHCHIVTTNIDAVGKRISLHNLGRDLSEVARQEIETKYELTPAAGRGTEQELPPPDLWALKKADYGRDETKKVITQIVNAVVQKYNYTSLAELNAALGSFNILADRGHEKSAMYGAKGLLYRIIDEKGNKLGVPIKASRIAGKHTLDKLEQRFEKNKSKRKILATILKQRINHVLEKYPNKQGFQEQLKERKIELLYRTSKDGHIYGLTFIDHLGRAVFNGSELGKAYGAKALLQTFNQLPQKQKATVNTTTSLNSKLPNPAKDDQNSYLQPVAPTHYLEILLGRMEQEHAPHLPKRKKKRKKRGQQTQQINL
ncbi:hypothetical protein ASU31_10400 [Pedobacter ginsenosidimutans]|uniref:MobA/VirD2-like nuclease domain-containing protein n=1 Tax=Pedobacter ginsenosidimutans TaxID=687842 RepID=A0A0T5VQI2_9SPHI|nr:relaxase/mobilization nuclease domain-containing protein [Pedobacter ginsenosidimutans]KRT15913.1 hypothetical protein ASU31_10400 [Pedobacter ginsenosidimutans]